MDELNFKFDFNAISDLEDAGGRPVEELCAEGNFSFNTLRLLVWAGLKGQRKGLTIPQAGHIVQKHFTDNGSLDELNDAVYEALKKSGLFANFTEAES